MLRFEPNMTDTSVRRLPGVSLTLFVAAAVVFAFPSATACLEYDRAAIAAGEIWRVVTCQWTHWDYDHLLWDAIAFVLLGILCERRGLSPLAACVAASTVLVPTAVWIVHPEISTYRGLSGIDSALFTLLAVHTAGTCLRNRDWRGAAAVGAVVIAFAAKIVTEVATGQTVFVDNLGAGFAVVPLAHVVGGAVGLAVGIAAWLAPYTAKGLGVARIRDTSWRTVHS